ncbi:MAG: hypothetical protein ACKVOQ_16660 [Cyclobacteriaceae bacterium]
MIQFKESDKSSVQTYSPIDITGFVLFEGTQIFNSQPQLSYYVKGSKDSANVFLRKLVSGNASLYFFTDEIGDKHYFLAKEKQLLELRYKLKEVKLSNGRTDYKPETAYNGVFNLLLSDCGTKSYDNVFSEASCIRIVNKYNQCKSKDKVNSNVLPLNDYVVTLDGDTINGFIDYVYAAELYENIKFKQSKEAPTQQYEPSQIKAYGLAAGPRLFESKSDLVIHLYDTGAVKKDMFTEVLVRGKASLLYAQASGRKEYYFLQKDAQIFELQKKEIKYVQDNGTILKKSSKDFNGIFNVLMGDCNHSSYDLNYVPSDFIKEVNSYNICMKSNSIIFKPSSRPKSKLYFGVNFTLSSSTLTLDSLVGVFRNGVTSYEYKMYKKLNQTFPTIGLYFDFQRPKNKHFYFNAQAYITGRYWQSRDVDISVVSIEFPLAIKYSFLPKHRMRPNLSYGLTIHKPLYSDYNIATVRNLSINNTAARFTMGVGVDYFYKEDRKFFFGFRYEGDLGKSIKHINLITDVFNFYFGYSKLIKAKKKSSRL